MSGYKFFFEGGIFIFDWKNEFNTGIKSIDDQHKKLFDVAHNLYDIANRNDGFDHYDEVVEIFGELSDYTVYHFKYEEELMDKYGFETQETTRHKFEHGAFVMKMLKIQKEDLDKNMDKVLMEVIGFAVDWITKHILNTDKKYAAFFIEKGIK